MQFMCETASRLLFMSVHWLKNIRAVNLKWASLLLAHEHRFRYSTLEAVMKTKWCDIFVLGLMQCADQCNLSVLLENMQQHLAACSRLGIAVPPASYYPDVGQLKAEKYDEVIEQIVNLLALHQRFKETKLSAQEFAYLKLISFTAQGLSGSPRADLSDIPKPVRIAECRPVNLTACQELFEHVQSTWTTSGEDSASEDPDSAANTAAVERHDLRIE